MSETRNDNRSSMTGQEAVRRLIGFLETAHLARLHSGGLFNAYEKAVQYELINSLYAAGLWGATVEHPLPTRSGRCDLVIPLGDDRKLWVELKMWWFLYKKSPWQFASVRKVLPWPKGDWEKLECVTKQAHDRAVVLLRFWDDHESAKATSSAWFTELMHEWQDAPAPEHGDLAAFRSPEAAEATVTLNGCIDVWSSISLER